MNTSSEPLYNTIGQGYNFTRQADPYLANRLAVLLNPNTDGCYIDIGCGTGNYTRALASRFGHWTGLDPSATMLAEAKHHAVSVNWVLGNAETIPVPGNAFDGAIATLTIHHWPNLRAAFQEIARVLKPGGRLVLFTATPEQLRTYWLNHYFPHMLDSSSKQMPTLTTIVDAAAGFGVEATELYYVRPDIADLFLYAGKYQPELYFNPAVRRGISSFAALAHFNEVSKGLYQLQNDLETGAFENIKAAYITSALSQGDYLFLVLRKNDDTRVSDE